MKENNMQELVNYCKQYGFIFQGSEIYGGLANTWDFGPVGVELKKKIDEIMNSEHFGNNNFELPKGIQEKTLDKIREYLREDTNSGHTSEQIAAFLDISKVTVRKYMHYLTKNSEVIEQINYDTGGRPCMVYFMK